MAQQHLDRPDIDARFEQVGRKTVAQRMDAVAMRDPRALLRMLGDLLGRADGHRPLGIASWKHPGGWPVQVPVGAQFRQQAGGEERIAILAAFALLDAEQPALTFAIRELQPHDVTDAQARGIRSQQEDAVPGILRMREQPLEFLDAQNLWQLRGSRPRWEVEVEDIPAQGLGIEELQPSRGLIAGTPGQAPLDEEVGQVGTNLLWTEASPERSGRTWLSQRQRSHRPFGFSGLAAAIAYHGSSWHVAGS
jgi:hypothetical protein